MIRLVNAYAGEGDSILIAFKTDLNEYRYDSGWRSFNVTKDAAIQLADQLRLLTKTTD